jgi:hypothetical protein
MPGQRAWEQAWRAGELDEHAARFWQSRPEEELYDLQADPHHLHNLASEPAQASRLAAMRDRLRAFLEEIGDHSFVPNSRRAPEGHGSFHARMTADPAAAALVRDSAWRASDPSVKAASGYADLARSDNADVRHWAAVGLTRLAHASVDLDAVTIEAGRLVDDRVAEVRIAAAEALAAATNGARGVDVLAAEVERNGAAAREALAAIETLGDRAASAGSALKRAAEARPRDFFVRSALITLGLRPYSDLYLGETDTD